MTVELNQNLVNTLPFESAQQDAILGYAMTNKEFFLYIKTYVRPNWFVDGWTGRVYDAWCKFYATFGHVPKSYEELTLFEPVFILPPLEKQKFQNTVIRAKAEISNYHLDVLQSRLTGWMKSRIYHQYMEQSATLFNNYKMAESEAVINKMVKELGDASFGGYRALDYNPWKLVADLEEQNQQGLTFGHPLIDRLVNSEAPNGCLLAGDSTVLIGPTDTGKSSVCITVIVANLIRGKKVLIYTHESRDKGVQQKVWQNLLNKTAAQYSLLTKEHPEDSTSDTALLLKTYAALFAKNLVHKHITKPGLTVEEIVADARQEQQKMINATGSGFDLLVDDYPAKLTTQDRQMYRERRHRDAYIYQYFMDFVSSEKIHGIFPIQTNREGSRKNKRDGDWANKRSLVQLEDVQEAYEVTNPAQNIITLNFSPEDRVRNLYTFFFAKSKTSMTNFAVTTKSNFACARSHNANDLATWFMGTSAPDNLDALMLQYPNSEIPWNYKDLQNQTHT